MKDILLRDRHSSKTTGWHASVYKEVKTRIQHPNFLCVSDEIQVADNAVRSVSKILQLEKSLLYARVDMVREQSGRPIVLELEITEPSLSMPLFPQSAATFINLLQERAVSL